MSTHPLQSLEWGEFRKQTGVKVVREGGLQVTIHRIPHTSWTVGYCPKATMPDEQQVKVLKKIATANNCILIKCEPMVEKDELRDKNYEAWLRMNGFVPGKPLFTRYNFVLDVTPSEQELMAKMKQKTRYNIRVAEKKGVKVKIDNSEKAFARYLELTRETTERQKFYAHTPRYHSTMWSVLGNHNAQMTNGKLSAHLLTAKYEGQIITTWMLFKYGDTLYYPYGASSREHREVMANNLVMWEAIKLAKQWGLTKLDMWGALSPNPDPKDPWYGFHKFKEGYGGRLVEYIGTWDYVGNPLLYYPYRVAEWIRWLVLRIRKGS